MLFQLISEASQTHHFALSIVNAVSAAKSIDQLKAELCLRFLIRSRSADDVENKPCKIDREQYKKSRFSGYMRRTFL